MNDSNHSSGDFQSNITENCVAWNVEEMQLMDSFSFWLSGVAIFCFSVIGSILNLLAIRILIMKESMQNLFNHLLITLFCADTAFLSLNIIQSVLNKLVLSDYLYFILFPTFLYPFTWITMTMSILMTVAIAHERYVAVRYPIKHRLQEKSAKFRRRRLGKYVIINLILSILLNIPHAFEARFSWRDMRNYTISSNEVKSQNFKYLDTYYMTKNPMTYVQR